MPRKPTPISREGVELLRQHVRIRSGLGCNRFSHMRLLHNEIQKNTGETLSFQTLCRFFGMVKNGFNPSADTLEIIARYLGHGDYNDFLHLHRQVLSFSGKDASSEVIVSIFWQLDPDDQANPVIMQLIRNVSALLRRQKDLAAGLYPAMSANVFCRKYFFEHFVNIDALNQEYGEALQHYLLHSWRRQDGLFVHAIYCYRAFLSDDAESFYRHFRHVLEFPREEILTFHPLLIGRYYACFVFDEAFIRKQANPSMNGGEKDRQTLFPGFDKALHGAGFLPGEAHILAGEVQEGWQLLNNHAMTSTSSPLYFNEELITEFNILRLFSGYFSGNISMKKAQVLLSELSGRPLFALSEDYFTFYLLILQRELLQRSSGDKRDITLQIARLAGKLRLARLRDLAGLPPAKIDLPINEN